MSLNLRQIEVFRAVMTAHSVSGAARLLNVSQPAVSRMLAYTEQCLGFPLFERAKSRLLPTPEAHALFSEIAKMYRSVEHVNSVARDLAAHRSGALHLVASPSLAYQFVPTALAQFRDNHADVKLTFRTAALQSLVDALLSNQAELGFSLMPPDHPNLTVTPFCNGEIVCVFPAGHPLSVLEIVSVAQLRPYSLVAYSAGSAFGTIVEKIYATTGETLRVSTEVTSPQEAYSIVAAGGGIALVDSFSVNSRHSDGIENRPVQAAPPLTVHLIHSRLRPLSLLAHSFRAALHTASIDLGFTSAST